MSGVVKLARPSVNFEQIPRSLIQHPSLSLEAKWLPIWLAAKPPAWAIRSAALMNELGWTKEKYYKAVKLLKANGYWTHRKTQGLDGQFSHFYEVRLEPIETGKPDAGFPASGFPEPGQPESGKPARIDNTIKKIKERQTIKDPAPLAPKILPAAGGPDEIEISDSVIQAGWLTSNEAMRIKTLANKEKNGQRLVDELVEQLHLQGRTPAGLISDPVAYFIKLKNSSNLTRAGEGASRRIRNAPMISISDLFQFKNGVTNAH